MNALVKRGYRYRFYPTVEQEQQLVQTFGCVRYVYNRALAERSRAWAEEQRRVSYIDTNKMLTGWKRDTETLWLAEPSKGPLQEALRNLQTAFDRFWRKQSRYPQFKKRGQAKDSAIYFADCFTYRDGRIRLAKQADPLDIRWSRPLPEGSVPSQVVVTRDRANRYHVSILVEMVVEGYPPADTSVGVDAGLTSLYTLSSGEKIANPRHEKRERRRLARAQRNLSRKEVGSRNRDKARLKVGKVHARIADRRRDHLHKLSTRLIRENQVVMIEDLSVKGMMKNPHLARAISDASWAEFRRMLEYKADWHGRQVVRIDRFYPSSRTCSVCGVVVGKLHPRKLEWTCRCGAVHDRALNAARNVEAAGLAVLACGESVSPARS